MATKGTNLSKGGQVEIIHVLGSPRLSEAVSVVLKASAYTVNTFHETEQQGFQGITKRTNEFRGGSRKKGGKVGYRRGK